MSGILVAWALATWAAEFQVPNSSFLLIYFFYFSSETHSKESQRNRGIKKQPPSKVSGLDLGIELEVGEGPLEMPGSGTQTMYKISRNWLQEATLPLFP